MDEQTEKIVSCRLRYAGRRGRDGRDVHARWKVAARAGCEWSGGESGTERPWLGRLAREGADKRALRTQTEEGMERRVEGLG